MLSCPTTTANLCSAWKSGAEARASRASVQLSGLDAWVYSKPFGNADFGGDIYYASSCATGRINRLLLADVSGHGDAVAESALALRKLMRRYVNFLDQKKLVRSLNKQFAALSEQGRFATAIATTFFAPTRSSPSAMPVIRRHFFTRPQLKAGPFSKKNAMMTSRSPKNVPLGIIPYMDYEQFDVELEAGDMVLCYTDALVEAHDTDGRMFGPKGLLRVTQSIDADPSESFIQSLLEKISENLPEIYLKTMSP